MRNAGAVFSEQQHVNPSNAWRTSRNDHAAAAAAQQCVARCVHGLRVGCRVRAECRQRSAGCGHRCDWCLAQCSRASVIVKLDVGCHISCAEGADDDRSVISGLRVEHGSADRSGGSDSDKRLCRSSDRSGTN